MKIIDWLFGSPCAACGQRSRGDKLADQSTGATGLLCPPCNAKLLEAQERREVEKRKEEEKQKEEERKRDEAAKKARAEKEKNDKAILEAAEQLKGGKWSKNLPSAEDLEKLPLRSIVAYAVRAARRVKSLWCPRSWEKKSPPSLSDRAKAEALRAADEWLETADCFAQGGKLVFPAPHRTHGNEAFFQINITAAHMAYQSAADADVAMSWFRGGNSAKSTKEYTDKAIEDAIKAAALAVEILPECKAKCLGDYEILVRLSTREHPEKLLGAPINTSAGGHLDVEASVFQEGESMSPASSSNDKAIANLLAAAQRGTDALMQVSFAEQLVCDSCGHQFLAVLGMQTGGRSTIVCPKCKKVVFTR